MKDIILTYFFTRRAHQVEEQTIVLCIIYYRKDIYYDKNFQYHDINSKKCKFYTSYSQSLQVKAEITTLIESKFFFPDLAIMVKSFSYDNFSAQRAILH